MVEARLDVDTVGAEQLAHDDALGTRVDKGAALGHHRHVAHEDEALLDFTGLFVAELRVDEHGALVRQTTLDALGFGVLRRGDRLGVVRVELQVEGELAGGVLDGRDVVEGLLQTIAKEPSVLVVLKVQEVQCTICCVLLKRLFAIEDLVLLVFKVELRVDEVDLIVQSVKEGDALSISFNGRLGQSSKRVTIRERGALQHK